MNPRWWPVRFWWLRLDLRWRSLVEVPLRALVLTGALLAAQAVVNWISPPPGLDGQHSRHSPSPQVMAAANVRR